MALFVTQGRVVGTLPPGRHTIDASELPFLGDLLDKLSGDKGYDSELFFATTREFPDLAFGGPVDTVRDPETKLVVELRAFGELSPARRRPRRLDHQLDRHRRPRRPRCG